MTPIPTHFPGRVPAATALRILLTTAGVHDPNTKKPFTEAMLYGIAGGVGIGAVAFHYAKEKFSSLFLAGRHLWFDDLLYLQGALDRLGIKALVQESSSAKAAEKQLRAAVAESPCIAWVDLALLPHRGLPTGMSGGGYHVIVVHQIAGEQACISDLSAEPISISLPELALARARIVKQKNRLLSLAKVKQPTDLVPLVHTGLQSCGQGLMMKGGKGPYAMSTLAALERFADRLHGSKDKESWENIFPPGINLWRALTSLYQFIERYGTGGGLGRPLMAEFLTEAAKSLKLPSLKAKAKQYAELGQGWTQLAETALPTTTPAMKEARESYRHYAHLFASNGPIEEKKQTWAKLDELAQRVTGKFPLDPAACTELRLDLQKRLRVLIEKEREAVLFSDSYPFSS
ncbi:MAG: BtrH N-terminal domain-containing protein [Planctomycetes bacterium]|nr:BtrH N-terminal domain-containing protein [Planctomycetota bacterium]